MPELQLLRADHASAVLAFERENRAYFAASIPDRGDAYFAAFDDRHAALLAEQDAGICRFHVLVDGGGAVVGRVNLLDLVDGSAELGYRVAAAVAGRGVATAAVREVADLARDAYGLHTLVARVTLGNRASRTVLTRAGFVPAGSLVLNDRPALRYVLRLRAGACAPDGRAVRAVRAPLSVLAGAPGAGKSYLLPYLLDRADGLVVADIDEILEDGALLGVPVAAADAAPVWPAYDRLWARITDLPRRAGRPVLMLRTTPSPADLEEGRPWRGPVRWALLDCPDDVRTRRLRERGWGDDEIQEAVEDGRDARTRLDVVFDGTAAPDDLAAAIVRWARRPVSAGSRPGATGH